MTEIGHTNNGFFKNSIFKNKLFGYRHYQEFDFIIYMETNNFLKIRKIEVNDINKIISICKNSFPKVVRWQSPESFLNNWWLSEIQSKASEAWVLEYDNCVSGFIILVTDVAMYNSEKKMRKRNLTELIKTFLFNPHLLLSQLNRKIINTVKLNINRKVLFENHTRDIDTKSIWIEPIAVSHKKRKMGFAVKLLEFCELRAAELGFDSIKLGVTTDNFKAINLYNKYGFVLVKETIENHIYEKKLFF